MTIGKKGRHHETHAARITERRESAFIARLASLVGIGATQAAAATCASLAGLALPDTTITLAEPVSAGPYIAPDGRVFANLPAFCRIAATFDADLGF
jgi:hypothetical protein